MPSISDKVNIKDARNTYRLIKHGNIHINNSTYFLSFIHSFISHSIDLIQMYRVTIIVRDFMFTLT